MTKHQRKEKAVELAGSIITLARGEKTIIVRDSHEDDGNITVRSSIGTAASLAKLLYKVADHFATQSTPAKEF